jgi:hypothetical protein
MARFDACDCQEPGCFRCAVGFVISRLGYSPDCDCFKASGKPCRNSCKQMFPDWVSAFDCSTPPYSELARRRAARTGLVVTKRIVLDEGDKSDDCPNDTASTSTSSVGTVIILEQNSERAAAEIATAAHTDPVSFDAAGFIVAKEIVETGIVPIALSNWAANVITGVIKRPKAKGKLTGATVARDKMICAIVQEVVDTLSLSPTSSDRKRGLSACHAVAQAFALLGLMPKSYQAIVKIFEKRNTLKLLDTTED